MTGAEVKKVFFLIVIFSVILFMSGCGRDYTASLSTYNTTINDAAYTLTQYYDSLYKLNRDLYFDMRREPVPTSVEEKRYNDYLIDLGKDFNAPEIDKRSKRNLLPVKPQTLDDLKKSINALALYSKDLVILYSEQLPEITYSTINTMSADLKNVTAYTNYSAYASNISAAGNLLGEISKQILIQKRNNYIKTFVNQNSDTIENYINALDIANTDIQNAATEKIIYFMTKQDILDYNDSVYYLKTHKSDTSAEILRQMRLNNIEVQYNLYVSLKNSDPKPLIAKLRDAQTKLSDYVNGRTKDPKALLNVLLEIKTMLSLINAVIP